MLSYISIWNIIYCSKTFSWNMTVKHLQQWNFLLYNISCVPFIILHFSSIQRKLLLELWSWTRKSTFEAIFPLKTVHASLADTIYHCHNLPPKRLPKILRTRMHCVTCLSPTYDCLHWTFNVSVFSNVLWMKFWSFINDGWLYFISLNHIHKNLSCFYILLLMSCFGTIHNMSCFRMDQSHP